MGKPQRGYKRSWKNLLLDRKYQLRFTLFMVAVSAVFMIGLGWFVFRQAETATQVSLSYIQGSMVDAVQEEAAKAQIRDRLRLLTGVMAAFGVLVTAGLFAYGIKMTHRVAGPLYKIGTYMDRVRGGRFEKLYSLRKGDQLVGFYEHFKDAHAALRGREEADLSRLRAVVAAADRAELALRSPDLAAALGELRMVIKQKEASLG